MYPADTRGLQVLKPQVLKTDNTTVSKPFETNVIQELWASNTSVTRVRHRLSPPCAPLGKSRLCQFLKLANHKPRDLQCKFFTATFNLKKPDKHETSIPVS